VPEWLATFQELLHHGVSCLVSVMDACATCTHIYIYIYSRLVDGFAESATLWLTDVSALVPTVWWILSFLLAVAGPKETLRSKDVQPLSYFRVASGRFQWPPCLRSLRPLTALTLIHVYSLLEPPVGVLVPSPQFPSPAVPQSHPDLKRQPIVDLLVPSVKLSSFHDLNYS
jgi:hypothetical protein